MTPAEIVNWVVTSTFGIRALPDADQQALKSMIERAIAQAVARSKQRLLARAMADAPVSEESLAIARKNKPASTAEHRLMPTREQWVALVDHLLAQIAHIRHDSGAYEDGRQVGIWECLDIIARVRAETTSINDNMMIDAITERIHKDIQP